MPRRFIMGIAGAVVVIAAIGMAIVGNQQGWWIGGKAKSLFVHAQQAKAQGDLQVAQAKLEELVSTFPDSPWTDDALLELGGVYEAQQQLVEARSMYRTMMERFPDSPLLSQAQLKLGNVNIALLLSPTITDLDTTYQVKPGDSLGKIAQANGTTVEFLKQSSGRNGDIIRPGQKLKVPKGRFSIVVDKSQNQLLLTEDNQFVKLYPVATGQNNSTPVGTFHVVNRLEHPVWYKQGVVVPPNSPENILGTHWLGLDKPGYGIHGSVDPSAMGQQVTAGCVRMINTDVRELFTLVPVGTEVTIVD